MSVSAITPGGIPVGNTSSVVVTGALMPDISTDAAGFVVGNGSCATPVAGVTASSSSGSGGSTTTLAVTAATGTSGVYRLCARWTPTSAYADLGDLRVFAVTSVSPPLVYRAVSQSLTVTGTGLFDNSAVPAAYTLAASCSSPSPSAVASLSVTYGGPTSVVLSAINASASVAGVYRLCTRMSASSPYFDIGAVNIAAFTGVAPSAIPITLIGLTTTTLAGAGLVDNSSDAGAFVVTSDIDCTGMPVPVSAVVSVASATQSGSSVVLRIDDSASAAGTYVLCYRITSTAPYIDTGLTITTCASRTAVFSCCLL